MSTSISVSNVSIKYLNLTKTGPVVHVMGNWLWPNRAARRWQVGSLKILNTYVVVPLTPGALSLLKLPMIEEAEVNG